ILMANRHQFKQSREERQRRIFSEEFKTKKVREIEQQITTIAQVSRQYEVRESSVSKWMVKYGQHYMKGVRTIVESQSDTAKITALRAQVAELQRIIGEKQVQLEFKDKIIDLAEEVYGVDIKKNSNRSPPLVLATQRKTKLQPQYVLQEPFDQQTSCSSAAGQKDAAGGAGGLFSAPDSSDPAGSSHPELPGHVRQTTAGRHRKG